MEERNGMGDSIDLKSCCPAPPPYRLFAGCYYLRSKGRLPNIPESKSLRIHLSVLGAFVRTGKRAAAPGTPESFYSAQKDCNEQTWGKHSPLSESCAPAMSVQITQYQVAMGE